MATEQRAMRSTGTTGLYLPNPPGTPGRDILFIDSISFSGALGSTTAQVALDLIGGNQATLNTVCTTTSGSATVTKASNFLGTAVGYFVVGPGIPDGTTVATYTAGTATMTISQNATLSQASVNLTIVNPTGSNFGWGSSIYGPFAANGYVSEQWVFPNGGLAVIDSTGVSMSNVALLLSGAAVTNPRTVVSYHFGTRP